VETLVLDNGIRLYLKADDELPLVQVTAMIGSGGIKIDGVVPGGTCSPHVGGASASGNVTNATNAGIITSLGGYVVKTAGKNVFFGLPGSGVVIKLNSQQSCAGDTATVIVKGGKQYVLSAGDVFSNAMGLSNGRGHEWQGADFNPGGGPDKLGDNGIGDKGWGTGNNGNGVGNTWVGNQGGSPHGGGMAGGSHGDTDTDTDMDTDMDTDTDTDIDDDIDNDTDIDVHPVLSCKYSRLFSGYTAV